jgi:hypothetical protein
MILLRVAVLFSLTVGCSGRLSAQTFAELKDLSQVKVVVEELDSEASHLGITREALEAGTIADLKREMPNVEVKDSAVSYVYVHVITSLKDNWCAVRVVVQLWRPVMVLKDNGDPVAAALADVRDRGTTLTGPGKTMGPRVLQDINEKITEMATDYNKANP